MADRAAFSREEVLDGKMFAVLSYLSILCIIPLILKKNNAFVLTHGRQGLVLFVGETAALILSIIIPWIYLPAVFIFMVFSFVGMVAAIRGIVIDLPVVAGIAEKIVL